MPATATTASTAWWRRTAHTVWRLVTMTTSACLGNRVTGLAAEAAFFAVLSVPPLVFALAGAIGYVSERFSTEQLDEVRAAVIDLASSFLTDQAVGDVIRPTLDTVLSEGRFDVISVGFLVALWSGSRALNVFVDTITLMHGLGGVRGIVATRALSFGLYLMAMVTGVISVPLVVAGPQLVRSFLPNRADLLMTFYWPVVIGVCVCFLATLYHVSVPVRTRWRSNLPGAVFTLVAWVAGSAVLRAFLTVTANESRSVYGPLAAPIAVLLWLYVVALAVLVGAALNAAVETVWPQPAPTRARRELDARLRSRVARARPRRSATVVADDAVAGGGVPVD